MSLPVLQQQQQGFVHSVYHLAAASDAEEDTLTALTPLCVLDPTLYHQQQV